MPIPPVPNVPVYARAPFALRANATTAFPLRPFVETKTPPWALSDCERLGAFGVVIGAVGWTSEHAARAKAPAAARIERSCIDGISRCGVE